MCALLRKIDVSSTFTSEYRESRGIHQCVHNGEMNILVIGCQTICKDPRSI